jgi:hypothetical protein
MHDARGKRGHHVQDLRGSVEAQVIRALTFLAASDLSENRDPISAQVKGQDFSESCASDARKWPTR